MALIGITIQNIGKSIIYSILRISPTQARFCTLIFHDNELKDKLKKINTIIIDEISMVSAELLNFISNTFATIHQNTTAFGGINTIVTRDLVQLPPINGSQVFKSPTWKLFYPLILR